MSPLPGVIINGEGDVRLSDGIVVTASDLVRAEQAVNEAVAHQVAVKEEEIMEICGLVRSETALFIATKVARRRQESMT